MVDFLIKNGSDVNERFDSEDTALILAARTGYVETVKLLLANGAYVNAKNKYGWTATKDAESSRHADVAEVLKAAGGHE
jgi:ankyrin repeat protein